MIEFQRTKTSPRELGLAFESDSPDIEFLILDANGKIVNKENMILQKPIVYDAHNRLDLFVLNLKPIFDKGV